jgi:tetratricopeptide (TPR) repeat protein
MDPADEQAASLEDRLDDVIAEYLRAAEMGPAPDRRELLSRHPDLASQLAAFFVDQDQAQSWTKALRPLIPDSLLARRCHCPHCHHALELVAVVPEDISCPSCGSTFRVEPAEPLPSAGQRRLGRFELLDAVGIGSFGTVYKARDPELDRIVAVKIPRAGHLADKEDLDRFLREGRCLAHIHHPGIVPVYEVGQTDGLPYLVTEFVHGKTLAELLRTQRFSPEDSAGLIAKVADALQYAHECGIIHRDLKPSNILLTSVVRSASSVAKDGDEPPTDHGLRTKDYGQPKVTDFGLAKREGFETTMTVEGQVLGTPAYMSPEQAGGEAHRVDGRSDVYSLGVTLYEALTGAVPFRGVPRMVLQQVLNDEPRPPRRLNDTIPRDLETICLKCLQKEPDKRYASAEELADDLRRFEEGRPVRARPIGRVEKAVRWARRNPIVSGSLAALVLVLLAGTAVSSYFAVNAARKAEQARANEIDAKEQAVEAKRQEETAKANEAQARRFEKEGRAAFQKYFVAVSEDKELKAVGVEPLRRKLLGYAREHLERFVAERGQDPTLQDELAGAVFRLAKITQAIGNKEEAIAYYQQARDLFQRLADDDATVTMYASNLAASHNNLGMLYFATGRRKDAETAYSRARDLFQKLADDHPTVTHYGRDLAGSHNNLGAVYSATGRPKEAEAAYLMVLTLRQKLADDNPTVPECASDLAASHHSLGMLYFATRRPKEAEAALHKALTLRQQLADDLPTVAEYALEMAGSHNNLGEFYRLTSRPKEAEAAYLKARDLQQKLADDHPNVTQYATALATSYNNLGILYAATVRPKEAEPALRKALTLRQKLADDHPTVPQYASDLAAGHNNLGNFYRETGRPKGAEAALLKARDVLQKLADDDPNVPEYASDLTGSLNNLANLYRETGRPKEAEAAYQTALSLCQNLVDAHPTFTQYGVALGGTLCNLANLCNDVKPEAALDFYARAIVALENVLARDPRHTTGRFFLRNAHFGRAQALTQLKRHADAVKDWDRAIDLDDGRGLPFLRLQQARSLVHAGEPAQALRQAAEMLQEKNPPAQMLYDLACVHTLCAAATKKEETAAKAVDLLRQAVANGYNNVDHLKMDSDLDALRRREDFKKLLGELEPK